MGIFNPHAPQMLGQEWVPIRDEVYTPDVFREVGYTFNAKSTYSLTQGRWYINETLDDITTSTGGQVAFQMNVYNSYREVETGPIQSVRIPVMAGSVSGTASVLGAAGTTVQAALSVDSGDNASITWNTGFGIVNMNFNTTAFSQVLNGARILYMNLVGTFYGESASSWTLETLPTGPFTTFVFSELIPEQFSIPLGEVTHMWNTSSTVILDELHAWRFPCVSRFSTAGATPRINLRMSIDSLAGNDFLEYVALEVFYCTETRLAEGARNVPGGSYFIGAQPVVLRGPTYNYPVSISEGMYTTTLNLVDFQGSNAFAS